MDTDTPGRGVAPQRERSSTVEFKCTWQGSGGGVDAETGPSGYGGYSVEAEMPPPWLDGPCIRGNELWRTHEVSPLEKVTNALMVKDFRPIAVLPVIFKLYSRVLYMLGENVCRGITEPQFAFRKWHQAHEVVFIIRQLVEQPESGEPHASS